MPSTVVEHEFHSFGVTNWHVAVRDGCSVMRFNKDGGGVDIVERHPSEWIFRPKWHDLAIIGLPLVEEHVYTAVSSYMLLTQEDADQLGIGPGAHIFMVGRFVDHDGRSTNLPSVRFGHISVMPVTGIKQPTNASVESYVLDVHSRTGYSGSPVFVYRTPGTDLRHTNIVTGPGANFVQLLGVHWGQFAEKWRLTASGKVKASSASPRRFIGEADIDGLSGMTCAVPSWAVLELLDDPRAKAFIDTQEDELRTLVARDDADAKGSSRVGSGDTRKI